MMKIFTTAPLIGCFMLSGCSGLGLTNDFAYTNAAIAQSNVDKFRAYSEGMAACQTEGCRLGLSMAFATGAGDQKMVQPERTAEVLAAFVPFASLGLQAFDMFYGGGPTGGDSGAFIITGDNNSLTGIGNNQEASDNSTIETPYSTTNSFSWSTNNRSYSLGNDAGTITDTGIVDPVDTTTTTNTADPVIPVTQ